MIERCGFPVMMVFILIFSVAMSSLALDHQSAYDGEAGEQFGRQSHGDQAHGHYGFDETAHDQYDGARKNQNVRINEFMSSNNLTASDEDGDFEDWIELVNTGSEPASTEHLALSDDPDDPWRWMLPDTTIAPGDFLLIWASGKDRTEPGRPLHANFAINRLGEPLLLSHVITGERIDSIPPVHLNSDHSFGRKPDGTGEWHFFREATPGAPNTTEAYRDRLDPPSFSHPQGFHTSAFKLEVAHDDPGATIFYTMNGDSPDSSSKKLESGQEIPIRDRSDDPNVFSTIRTTEMDGHNLHFTKPDHPVAKGTVLRVLVTRPGYLPEEITKTYFVFDEGVERYSFPVVSVVSDSMNLFGHEEGIYVPGIHYEKDPRPGHGNYRMRGRDWEAPSHVTMFEEDGSVAFDQGAGLRIHGGFSRQGPQKSLRLYARTEYGDDRFHYPVFPDQEYYSYNRLLLRNSGNDWVETMFRDAASQTVVRHMNFKTQAYRPALVFINGEYWGIQNFRERYDRHLIGRAAGVDEESIDLLDNNMRPKEGDSLHYRETRDIFVKEDMSDPEQYQRILKRIDMDNLLDYYTAQVWFGNDDWPHNNIDFWRLRTEYRPDAPAGHDGRWRWMLVDTDRSMALFNHFALPNYDLLDWLLRELNPRTGQAWPNELLRNLLDSPEFHRKFVNRMAGHLNTTFRPERVKEIVGSMADVVRPEIGEHIGRWERPQSKESWQGAVNNMLSFADLRPDHVRNHIREHLGTGSPVTLTVDVSDAGSGYVQVESIDLVPETPGVVPPSNQSAGAGNEQLYNTKRQRRLPVDDVGSVADVYPWEGVYFEEVPVKLVARAWPGYQFSHWEKKENSGDYKESQHTDTLMLSLSGDAVTEGEVHVKAVFEPDNDQVIEPKPHVLASGEYRFEEWPADTTAGAHPPSLAFVYMDRKEPRRDAEIEGETTGLFHLQSRTRVTGHGTEGFAFINTSHPDGNEGYPGRRLGGALLNLDTRDVEENTVSVSWTGLTHAENSRRYHLRLQYRIGDSGPFHDVTDAEGNPVTYKPQADGESAKMAPHYLSGHLIGKPLVQLFWRYYYSGKRTDPVDGSRSWLGVSDISVQPGKVTGTDPDGKDSEGPDSEIPSRAELKQNYPNPFNPVTVISYRLPGGTTVRLDVYDTIGRRVVTLVDGKQTAGSHDVTFDGTGLASGVYIYHLEAGDVVRSGTMTLLK